MLDVKNIERRSVLRLACAEGVGEHAALQIGEQSSPLEPAAALPRPVIPGLRHQRSAGRMFASGGDRQWPRRQFAALSRWRISCAFPRSIRSPYPGPASRTGCANIGSRAQNLEMIQKLGWDENNASGYFQLCRCRSRAGVETIGRDQLPDPPILKRRSASGCGEIAGPRNHDQGSRFARSSARGRASP